MDQTDIIVLGGGIAGLSAAAALSRGASVRVLEAEDGLGVHSSGRSATFYHLGIGNTIVRALTTYSRQAFEGEPSSGEPRLASPKPALWIATTDMLQALDSIYRAMRVFSDDVHHVAEKDLPGYCPVLRTGGDAAIAGVVDMTGAKLDADLLLQGRARTLKRNGGSIETGVRIDTIERLDRRWRLRAGDKTFEAGLIVNATGAWADETARLAGAAPLGLTPLRRTIIVFDPPEDVDARTWPFVKTAVDEFYMLPEAGRLLASPVDEIPSAPLNAQPEDYDVALAAYRVEQYTTMQVTKIAHRWAGLRSFVADRIPTAGFARDTTDFFWLAGQGGYGLQTSFAMADATASLILGTPWPERLAALGVSAADISPLRPGLAGGAGGAAKTA